MVSYSISFNTLLCTFSSILIINSRVGLVEAISEPTLVDTYCTSSHNYTTENPFGANVDLLLSSLSSNASSSTNTKGFYNTTVGQDRNQVYGLYLCRGDVAHNTCSICVETAVKEIKQSCASNQQAILWYEECFLWYSFRHWTSSWWVPQAYKSESRHISDPQRFNQTLSNLMDNLAERAISNSASSSSSTILYFATGEANSTEFQKIYGLLQCIPDLSPSDCNSCLRNAIDQIFLRFNESSSGLSAYYLYCVARYSDRLFYELNSSASAPPRLNGKEGSSLRIIFITATPVIIMVILLSVLLFYVKRRRRRRNRKSKEYVLNEITSGDTLQFDFSTIRDATDNFSDANKLGVGGFGTVYKGRLSNGLEVAVKRHSTNSTQGELEFENEVALVAKLQHRNLVRLLGFCLEGKLLIYEFVPNGSLDYALFDTIKRADLDWEKRYKIIEGIARGLLYLHQDSSLKIVHRDLKPSNILLDANMNPKISDFGLAKLVKMEQSREKTKRIAGTVGYMAPEYAIKGRFSVKSDVYSFGVILLEILSGKRVNSFYYGEDSQHLLGYAWRLWHEDRGLEFIDPMLRDSCPTPDALRCLLVGLLCVQGDVECRPTMLSVVWMLKQTLNILPQPREPAISSGKTRLEANWNTSSLNVPEIIHSGFLPR